MKARYTYTVKSATMQSQHTGVITPERHAIVCAALEGGLGSDLKTLLDAKAQSVEMARLREALEWVKGNGYGDGGRECVSVATLALDGLPLGLD